MLTLPGGDLPVTILNHTANTVTLKNGFVLGVVSDVSDVDLATDGMQRPAFEIRTLYADQFRDCFPAVKSEDFSKLQLTLPEHIQDLFRRSCTHISLYQAVQLANLLTEFALIFSKGDMDLGHFKGVYHRIITRNTEPLKQHMRRTPIHFEQEEEATLKKMLDAGVIVESKSEYAHPVCLVRKKDGSVRYCIDMRLLNQYTVKDRFPLPRIEQCLDTLCGNRYFSTLDLAAGYWQISIYPEDCHKTAFITKYGLFEHKMMSSGLCNAPATFQRAMQFVLSGLLWSKALCYLDDVVTLGDDFDTAMANLREVFGRFRDHNLKMKPKKCVLFQEEVEYLGRLVSRHGVTLRPDHVKIIREWPVPTTKKQLQSFLGFTNYHREFIKYYSVVVEDLQMLVTKSKAGPIQLAKCHLDVIQILKEKLSNAPIFPYPNPECTFLIDCDASETAIGCELSQVVDGKECVILYGSFSLTPAQRKYCTTRKELLAVVRFTRQFRHYLLGRQFVCRTDHNSLTWLMSFKNIEGQLARWMEELAQFDMVVVHRAGKLHVNADALSRIPETEGYCPNYRAGVSLSDLPCYSRLNPCKFCTRTEARWARFEDEVDYVVPLSVRRIQVDVPSGGADYWLSGYSKGDLRREQIDDGDLSVIIGWLESKKDPTQFELGLQSPAVRHYWQLHHQLFFVDGVLFYKWVDFLDPRNLLVVPTSLQEEVLQLNHDVKDSGHVGQVNTFLRVKGAFYWFRMRSDVYNYVKTCAKCNTNKKPSRRRRSEMGQYHAGAPMDRVMIDMLGPLSKTPRGNTVILMLVDQFTKWVECYPLPDQSAELVAKTIVDEFFSRFGLCLELHTDQGKNFMSNLFTVLCELLQIIKTRTTGYRPCSNGQIERMNRTVLQMIRCLRDKNIRDWDLYLPHISSAIRSTVNRSSGFTPNKLMLGREVYKPVHVLFGIDQANRCSRTPAEYVVFLEKTMKEIHELARKNLRASVLYNKRDYDQRLYQASYNEGDLVYILDPSNKPGISTKLQPIYRGPFLIIKRYSPVLYMVQDRKRKLVAHHDRLLICNDRFIPLWMRKLRQEFLDLDETLPYDEAELEELNLFEAPPEVGIKDLFDNRVKYSNSDTNSRESGDYESDRDAGPLTTSGGLVPNDVVGDLRDTNLINFDTVTPSNLPLLGDSESQANPSLDNGVSRPNPLTAQIEVTRSGRKRVPPGYLRDYDLGD